MRGVDSVRGLTFILAETFILAVYVGRGLRGAKVWCGAGVYCWRENTFCSKGTRAAVTAGILW